jgi:SPP1 gp7 family putative phage head morphogenesis protein
MKDRNPKRKVPKRLTKRKPLPKRTLTMNPFQSESQRRYLWANRPDIAEKWAHEYPGQKGLQKYKKKPTTNRRKPNPLRIDPTRTATIRRQFIASLKRQFARLKVAIMNKIVKEDALDLTTLFSVTTHNKAWKFHTSPEKIEAFQKWLSQQLGDTVTGKSQEVLWKAYIQSGYMKGIARSFDDTRGNTTKALADTRDKMDFYNGIREEFLRSSFSQPVAVEKVQLLAGRSFDDLENITDDMSTRMSRVLVDGLVEGNSPREVGRALSSEVDLGLSRSTAIARTEIIRAHAEGQLDSLERMGIKEVGVMVEWSTAGDDSVCEECASMEGTIMDIDDAHGLIPVHPNCRCAFIPYIPDTDEEDSNEEDASYDSSDSDVAE